MEPLIVSVDYKDHPSTARGTWQRTYPRSNINFENILRTEFQLDVVGGPIAIRL